MFNTCRGCKSCSINGERYLTQYICNHPKIIKMFGDGTNPVPVDHDFGCNRHSNFLKESIVDNREVVMHVIKTEVQKCDYKYRLMWCDATVENFRRLRDLKYTYYNRSNLVNDHKLILVINGELDGYDRYDLNFYKNEEVIKGIKDKYKQIIWE
jgi:hypothetical protein